MPALPTVRELLLDLNLQELLALAVRIALEQQVLGCQPGTTDATCARLAQRRFELAKAGQRYLRSAFAFSQRQAGELFDILVRDAMTQRPPDFLDRVTLERALTQTLAPPRNS